MANCLSNVRRSVWLLCSLMCVSGCLLVQPRVVPIAQLGAARALTEQALVVPGHTTEPAFFVTARRTLPLAFQSSAAQTPQIAFCVRRLGDDNWRMCGTWTVGQPLVEWSPPREGVYEFVALPASLEVLSRVSNRIAPTLRLAIDWTAPSVRSVTSLPTQPIVGGSMLPLGWVVDGELFGLAPVQLAIAEGLSANWRELAELPPHGYFEWQVPNRPVTNARLRLSVRDTAGNSLDIEMPGALNVTCVGPQAQSPAGITSNAPVVLLPYAIALPGASAPQRVELWVTIDGGDSWNLHAYDHDLTPPFSVELADGVWGYQVVVIDADGNRSDQPVPGDTPRAKVLVDRVSPTVEWGPLRVERAAGGFVVDQPYVVHDSALDIDSIEAAYRADTEDWLRIPTTKTAEGVLRVKRAELAREPLLVRIAGRDHAGNHFNTALESWPRETLDPPIVRFLSQQQGWFRGGAELPITYEVNWLSARPDSVTLEYTTDHTNWLTIASDLALSGRFLWLLPNSVMPSAHLRMRVRGGGDRQLIAMSEGEIAVDPHPPRARVLGPLRVSQAGGAIQVEGMDGESFVRGIDLFARSISGDAWSHVGRVDGGGGHVELDPLNPGFYLLWAVATDGAGNTGISYERASLDECFKLTVDAGQSGIRLSSFQDGGIYSGGTRHPVLLTWQGERPLGARVRVEFSGDDGGSWREICVVAHNTERVNWELPKTDVAAGRLRAVAQDLVGDVTQDQSRVPFVIDSSPPDLEITQAVVIGGDSVRLEYRDREPALAPLQEIQLYLREEAAADWQLWPRRFAPSDAIVLKLDAGRYAFALTAMDTAGNAGLAPTTNALLEATVEIGPAQAARIELLAPRGGSFGGGTRHHICWRLEGSGQSFAETPVHLEYRELGASDDEWVLIQKGLPADGIHPWQLPELVGGTLELRVTATDANGASYSAVSDALEIDSRAPIVELVGPTSSTTGTTEICYRVANDDLLAAVELYLRAVSTPQWKRAGSARAGEPLRVSIADGMYRVALVAVDHAGNRGPKPMMGEKGQGDLLVDTVTPLLKVEGVGERERIYHEGETVTVSASLFDSYPGQFPIAFRMSEDGGESYRQLKRYHPNGHDYSFELPDRAGLYYLEITGEDLAGNRARELRALQVIKTAPRVVLLTDPTGGIFSAASEFVLEWECRGVDVAHTGLSIEFTTDGVAWTECARDLAVNGSFPWTLPTVDSNRCQLRLTVTDVDGLSGRLESGHFTISHRTPRVRVEAVRPVRPRANSSQQ
ncbi:MAG: hypothetical protein ACKVX7_07540 [Planctomycetota bacterium]